MVKKYEHLQYTMQDRGSIRGHQQRQTSPDRLQSSSAEQNRLHTGTFGGLENDSFRRQPEDSDPTSRFVRELRDRQSMVQDTQNMYAVG